MQAPATVVPHGRVAPTPSLPAASAAIAALLVDERDRDLPGISIPRPEIHLVVRFGPSTRGGLDVHAMGVRETVVRKLLRGGQRTVTARLRLGAHEAVLGVSASAIVGRVVSIDDLWGDAAARRLHDRLGDARTSHEAATILERTIADRLVLAHGRQAPSGLALDAARRLPHASIGDVATSLGVSERHLRRLFREAVGVGPKTFARLERFRRALTTARAGAHPSWAEIALASGYYDQAHLIAEFRAIAGVTPQALLGELRTSLSLG